MAEILRPTPSPREQVLLFDDFVLDRARGCLLDAGQPIHLRPQAYAALTCLAEHAGRLVTKDQLTTVVWQGRAVTDDSLVQCIGDVRRALRDDRGQRLRTVRGRGYILDLDVPAPRARTAAPTPAEPEGSAPRLWRRERTALAVAGAIVTVSTALALLPREQVASRIGGADPHAFEKLTSSPAVELRPNLSPDGKWLLFDALTPGVDEDSQIFLRSLEGGAPVCLTCGTPGGGRDGAFSPSGDLIAYATDSVEGGVFVMRSDGQARRRLTARGVHPDWSPDGQLIAYATRQTDWIPVAPTYATSELWIVDVATGAGHHVPVGDARDPVFSPDGRRIAYWAQPHHGAPRDVFIVTRTGDLVTQITENAGDNWHPTWAPDGRALYFVTNRTGNTGLWRVPIDERSGRARGPAAAVALPTAFVAYPRAAAKDHLTYADANAERNMHLLSFDVESAAISGPPRRVTQGTEFWMMPQLSPRGDWLVMSRAAITGQEDLFTIRRDGTRLRRLTTDRAFDREPDISPDERRIAFESNRGGLPAIWLIDADGGDLHPLTAPSQTIVWTSPRWSPDGRVIAARQQPGHQVVLLDPNRPLAPPQAALPIPAEAGVLPMTTALSLTRVAWSADGRQLAARFGPLLAIYSLDRGTSRTTRIDGAIVGWPPGPFIVLDHWIDRKLVVLDTRTWQTREIPYAPHLERDDRLMLSADGRTLAVERGTYKADIWLMRSGVDRTSAASFAR